MSAYYGLYLQPKNEMKVLLLLYPLKLIHLNGGHFQNKGNISEDELGWLQSPVTKIFSLRILFDNPLK